MSMGTATTIDGITDVGEGEALGQRQYAVALTLFVDGWDPEEASKHATLVRDCIGLHGIHCNLPFPWHLHDHAGC